MTRAPLQVTSNEEHRRGHVAGVGGAATGSARLDRACVIARGPRDAGDGSPRRTALATRLAGNTRPAGVRAPPSMPGARVARYAPRRSLRGAPTERGGQLVDAPICCCRRFFSAPRSASSSRSWRRLREATIAYAVNEHIGTQGCRSAPTIQPCCGASRGSGACASTTDAITS